MDRQTSLRIGLVGPLPPPSGGMANQTRQLSELLTREGHQVEVIQVNAPYHPAWIGHIRGIRAAARLLPYLWRLWSAAGRVQLFHVMANSGWSWHLFAAPAVAIAKLRGIGAVVNYRGGGADGFFARSFRQVRRTLKRTDAVVVPSGFLQEVFERYGTTAAVVPNIIDLTRFSPTQDGQDPRAPHLVVTRNLEPIYDVATAIRAFQLVKARYPTARLTVAGSGPERANLEALTRGLGLDDAITFTGRLDNKEIASLYRTASVMINPSRVDNMPISILEALASGVPVVSTNVGGIPYLVESGITALLVPPEEPKAMAEAVLHILDEPAFAQRLIRAGLETVLAYSWPNVRDRWMAVYETVLHGPGAWPGHGKNNQIHQ